MHWDRAFAGKNFPVQAEDKDVLDRCDVAGSVPKPTCASSSRSTLIVGIS